MLYTPIECISNIEGRGKSFNIKSDKMHISALVFSMKKKNAYASTFSSKQLFTSPQSYAEINNTIHESRARL